jgi:hypothetical protein
VRSLGFFWGWHQSFCYYVPKYLLPNRALQRTSKSLAQLTMVAVWRHTQVSGSVSASALDGR